MVYLLPDEPFFPPADEAEPDGLIAIGGDLSPRRLINAYASGIFPWFQAEGEVYWFSPDPRLVILPQNFRLTESLARTLASHRFEVRMDTSFRQVIEECSTAPRPGQEDTWISNDFIEAYCMLHDAGYAHSIETFADDKLVGGLYGVSLGSAFFGESMFFRSRDASKVALFHLAELVQSWDFAFIDCQVESPHLISLGAETMARESYLKLLKTALSFPTKKGKWSAA